MTSSAVRDPPLEGCDAAPGVMVLPDLKALVGASEGIRAVGTFRLSRARKRSNLVKAKMTDEKQ